MKPVKDEAIVYQELQEEITHDGSLLYVGRLIERASKLYGSLPALLFKDSTITYNELSARASALTQLLKDKGVKPRDRVIISFENSPEFFIAYYGVLQAGAVVAPVNTFLKERELAHIIKDAQPALIITSPDRLELFKTADGQTVPPLLSSDEFPEPSDQSSSIELIDLPSDEMAALLYTSGTTGLPKGVMLSSKNIMTNVL